MKTNKFYTVLTIIMVVLFALALNASALEMNLNEAYLDNPPEVMVFNEYANHSLSGLVFEEETYIDDIPFNTKTIAAENSYKKACELEFEPEEEAYIDDIPFDTYSITQLYVQNHYAYHK